MSVVIALIGLGGRPAVAGVGAEDGTATPIVQPTPGHHARLTISALQTYDGGHRSATLYAHHVFGFSLRYRLFGGRASGGTAVFRVVAHGATIAQTRSSLHGHRKGVVSVHIEGTMTAGRKELIADVQIGGRQSSATRTFVVFDPSRFLLGQFLPGGAASAQVARVESNPRTAHDPYIVHLGRRTFAQLGRQNGTFEIVRFLWPHLDRSQVTVQADLTSIFGSRQLARTAFWAQVAQYEIMQDCHACATKVAKSKVDGRLGGQLRAGFLVTNPYGVRMREILFVQGRILVEGWSYVDGAMSTRLSRAVLNACAATLLHIDNEVRAQESE